MTLQEKDSTQHSSSNSFFHRLKSGIPSGFVGKLSWQYVTTIWSMIVGFAYSLLLGRSLGVSEFGLISLAMGFTTVVFQIFELRLHEAVIRYVAEFWENKDLPRMSATVKLSLVADVASGMLALAMVLVLMPLASRFLIHDDRSSQLLLLAGVTVFCSNVATATAFGILRTFGQFKLQSFVTVIGTTVKLAATYAAIRWFGCGVIGVMLVGIVSSFVMNSVMIWVAFRCINQYVSLSQPSPRTLLDSRLAEIRRFVGSTYLFSLSSIPTKELDVTLLGLFAPASVVGVYKMAKNFITAMWAVSDPVFYVVYPELSRLRARLAFASIGSFLKRLTLLLGAAAVFVYAASMFFVPILIRFTLGAEYAEAANIFRWMAWFILFWMPFLWINPLLLSAARADLMLKASLAGNALIAVLYVVLIPTLGAKGAALAYALGTPLGLLFAFWFAHKGRILDDLFYKPKSAVHEHIV